MTSTPKPVTSNSFDLTDQWLAEELKIKTVFHSQINKNLLEREQAGELDGIEIIQAMMSGDLPNSSMANTLEFTLIDARVGTVTIQCSPKNSYCNRFGTIHGGWFATVLDTAMGNAVQTQLAKHKKFTTAELSVNIVRPLSPETSCVRATGTVIHFGSKLATAEAKIIGPDGKLYAHGTCTCLLI